MRKLFTSILIISIILSSCSSVKGLDSEVINEKRNRAAEYAQLGTKFFSDSDYEKALDFFFLSLKQNISIDNEEGIIASYNSIGKTYFAAGDLETTGIYFGKADKSADFFGDPIIKARSLNNIGELHLAEESYTDAMRIFKEALALIEDPEKTAEAAIILHNIGIVYKRDEDFENAELTVNEALSINTRLNKSKEMASNNYILSSIYSKREDYATALLYIKEALSLDKKLENSQGIAKDIYAHGLIYQYMKSYDEAYTYFQKSVLIYETLSLSDDVIKTLLKLEETALNLSLDDEANIWKMTREALEDN